MAIMILKPGIYLDKAGRRFEATPDMLAEVAATYDPVVHHAPLTKGHPTDDAEPAYGWLGGVRFEGGVLVGEPDHVDPAFREAVNGKRFPFVSPSFYQPDNPANPTPGKWHLRHLAFLGAVPPAAKGQGMAQLSDGEPALELREFTAEERSKLAKSGAAMPDGSYPIENEQDLKNAIHAVGRANAADRPKVTAHITKRAKALGLEKLVPPEFSEGGAMEKMSEFFGALLDTLKGMSSRGSEPPQLSEGDQMDKEAEAALAAKEKALADQQKALDQKSLELSERQKQIDAAEEKSRKAAALEFAEALSKSGQILPREKMPLAEVLASTPFQAPFEFSEGDKKIQTTAKAVLEPILKRLGKAIEFSELAAGEMPRQSRTPVPAGYTTDPERMALHAKALAFSERNHVDYVTAVQAVQEVEG